MKLEPGDLLMARDQYWADRETRMVIAVQPYPGIPETVETEALLLYPDGTMCWYSSKYIASILRKVGGDTEELE